MIEDICLSMPDGQLLVNLGLPAPNRDAADPLNSELVRETNYNTEELERFVADNVPRFNLEQLLIYEKENERLERERETQLIFYNCYCYQFISYFPLFI